MATRATPDAAVALIKRYEGFSPKVYICPAGYPTIGYGHVVLEGETYPFGLSKESATELLKKDLRKAELSVRRLISAPLTDGQYGALVSFTFNLGGGALQRSTLRAKVNRMEYDSAANEFGKWVFAGGRKLTGLVKRRTEEAAMFAAG
jgi:lysozyme